MALPFLVPMLIGAGVGAITNPDDRLRGALLGGTLGALTGGLGGGAAGAQGATQSALSAATGEGAKQAAVQAGKQATVEAGKQAAKEGAKEAVKASGKQIFNAAELGTNVNPATTGFNPSIQAPGANLNDIVANATEVKPGLLDSFKGSNVGNVSQNPGITSNSQIPQSQMNQSAQSGGIDFNRAGERFKAGIKENPMQAIELSNAMLGGGQQQQQAPVYAPAPIQQGQFGGAPTVEESLGLSNGDPSFIPRGLFSKSEAEEERRLMLERMQAGTF